MKAALVVAVLLLAGCAAPAPTCERAARDAATPAEVEPCAAQAAARWREDAVLVAVEGSTQERALDGALPEWRFVYASSEARISTALVVGAGGAVLREERHAWGDSVAPHPDGYGAPLDAAWLDASRLAPALREAGVDARTLDEPAWRAYALVSLADGASPTWLVAGGAPAIGARVDPADWRVVEWSPFTS